MTSSNLGSLSLSLSLGLVAGCGLTLDYTPPDDATLDDALPRDGGPGVDAPGLDAPGLDAPGLDAPGLDAPALDAPELDAPPDVGPVECVNDGDCSAMRVPPCGTWECNAGLCEVVCSGCTTDVDRDGYGLGPGCAGLDCDDADDAVDLTASRACYGGPTGTEGMGACAGGTETCALGAWSGACFGATLPSAESCNAVDDDCNGSIDDGLGRTSCGLGACSVTVDLCSAGGIVACAAPLPITTIDGCGGTDDDCDGRIDESCTDCVWVGLATGSDTSTDPRVVMTPFRTVQRAIDWAVADPTTRPQRVCLLSNGCSAANAVFPGPVTMAGGVSVAGSFAPSGATVCPAIRTEIRTGDATGVLFPAAIAARGTTLSDVAITPHTSADVAGVTIDGARGVVLRNVLVNAGSAGVTNGYGVSIRNGADALITRSSIFASRGSAEAIGVRVDRARVTLLDDCPTALDGSGRCASATGCNTGNGIHGRNDATPTRGSVSYAVLLRDAPGSIVSGVATCGHTSLRGAGIRIEGAAAGTVVRGSFVAGWGGQNESYGIDMLDCGGDSPWIVDNAEINAEGPMTAPIAAVRSLGDCHPVIERNLRIISGLEGQGMTTGVLCGPSALGGSSRCVLDRNALIRSTAGGNPISSTGVRCEADGCARITENVITAFQGQTIVGLFLGTTDAFVSRNHISGGCPTMSAVGLHAIDSRARVENNVILGGSCGAGTTSGASRFIALLAGGTSSHVLDLRSNTLDPGGALTTGAGCTSRGIELDGTAGRASIRGNIALAGGCRMAYPLYELDATADPFALESNDFVAANATSPVYRDEGTTDLMTAALVNALGDTSASGNLDTPAGFVGYPANLDLGVGSMCIDADTAAGAPAIDFDGHARVGVPDIGAYEH